NLVPMRDEQEREVAMLLAQPRVVERGDDGLAGARRGDDEVLHVAVGELDRERIEHGLLVGGWTELDGSRERVAALVAPAAGLREPLAIIRLELVVLPVLFERLDELPQDRVVVDGRKAYVPFAAVEQRRGREVRRAHEPGVETRFAM